MIAIIGDGWSARARLIPYLESVALASAIDFDQAYGAVTHSVDGADVPIASFRVPTYLCLSETNDRQSNQRPMMMSLAKACS